MKKYILLLVSLVVFSAQLKAEIDPKAVAKKIADACTTVYESPKAFDWLTTLSTLMAEKVVLFTDKETIKLLRDQVSGKLIKSLMSPFCLNIFPLKTVNYYPSPEMDKYILLVASCSVFGNEAIRKDLQFYYACQETQVGQTIVIPFDIYILSICFAIYTSEEFRTFLSYNAYSEEIMACLNEEEKVWYSKEVERIFEILKLILTPDWLVTIEVSKELTAYLENSEYKGCYVNFHESIKKGSSCAAQALVDTFDRALEA